MNTKPISIALAILFSSLTLQAQDLDTLVDVGTHKMHFNIWNGTGIPILFEAGGGNDGNIWSNLVKEIYSITGSTIITYDRVGYGKSEYNPNLPDDKRALITNGIDALEKGLQKLGLNKELILVAHSYGGYYATYLAAKHPSKIKGIVLIDAVTSTFHSKEFMERQKKERTKEWLNNIKEQSEPLYFECLANAETIGIMKNNSIPADIPVINLVADNPPYDNAAENERWKSCHQEFVKNNPNRIGILAYNCGHYVHFDNPKLAVDAIVRLSSELSTEAEKAAILKRYLVYSNNYTNTYRQQEYEYWHSERDLNNWGYSLLTDEKLEEALKLFELNTMLFPDSYNVWDSYGEALLLHGDKEKARKMYEKSLELNPDNGNAKEVLSKLKD